MPMFQDSEELEKSSRSPPPVDKHGDGHTTQPIDIQTPLCRRVSEESIRTELCEGPVPDSPTSKSPDHDVSMATSDRAELIERLKRGESPTWIPNRHLESMLQHCGPLSPTRTRSPRPPANTSPTLLPAATITSGHGQSEHAAEDADSEARLREGLEIERPRSALHSGDFTQHQRRVVSREDRTSLVQNHDSRAGVGSQVRGRTWHRPSSRESAQAGATSDEPSEPSHPWLATSPPRPAGSIDIARRTSLAPRLDTDVPASRFSGPVSAHSLGHGGLGSELSSLSSSFSSSFVFKQPTSPLVQSESNDDIDFTLPMGHMELDSTTTKTPRRHTLTMLRPPQLAQSHWSSTTSSPQAQAQPQAPAPLAGQSLRRANGLPAYQAHQPRRSLTITPSIWLTAQSTPSSPGFLRSRRPSLSSDSSPLQHASMVGSYEESILRGRMSTTPSRPLDFLAQIGVLGIGKCKSSLRCPSHVTLPFSAVFYSYSSTSHSRSAGGKSEDGPSPYVGMVDLENGLANPEEEARARRKLQSRTSTARRVAAAAAESASARELGGTDIGMSNGGGNDGAGAGGGSGRLDGDMDDDMCLDAQERGSRSTLRSKRRSSSPKAPPGGSYRIPAKGQLQIIIKNQNKTAVKLFLVPYDLSGMEPGSKTFIRQRIFSAGLEVENGTGSQSNPGESEQNHQQQQVPTAASKPILRYLIHLHICCPSKGRYYLYKSIRVVFANRVPDGKEKLRNEVTYPEPRFSTYKPVRVMHPPLLAGNAAGGYGIGGAGAMLAADKAYRRRSSGFSFASPHSGAPGPFDLALLDGGGISHTHSMLAHAVSTGAGPAQSSSAMMFRSSSSPSSPPMPPPGLAMSRSAGAWSADSNPRSISVDGARNLPVEPVPFPLLPSHHHVRLESVASQGSEATTATQTVSSPSPSQNSRPATGSSHGEEATARANSMGGVAGTAYDKLNRGDIGYGGNAFSPPPLARGPGGIVLGSPPLAAEGLLSKRLRSLGVQGELGGVNVVEASMMAMNNLSENHSVAAGDFFAPLNIPREDFADGDERGTF